jgi:hypothetical protein
MNLFETIIRPIESVKYFITVGVICLVIGGVLGNLDSLKETLGIETVDSLRDKVEQLKRDNRLAVEISNQNKIELDRYIKLVELKGATNATLTNKNDVLKATLDNITKTTKDKLKNIPAIPQITDYGDLEQKAVEDYKLKLELVLTEASKIQITSLWKSYCVVQKDPKCSENHDL